MAQTIAVIFIMKLSFKLATYISDLRIGDLTYDAVLTNNTYTIKSQTTTTVKAFDCEITQNISSEITAGLDYTPIREVFTMMSGGNITYVESDFYPDKIACKITSAGTIITKEIPIPPGTKLMCDTTLCLKNIKKSCKIYSFNPIIVDIEQTEIVPYPNEDIIVNNKAVRCRRICTYSQIGDTTLWVDNDGAIVKCTTAAGIVMKQNDSESESFETIDLPHITRITANKHIPRGSSCVKLRITDANETKIIENNALLYDTIPDESYKKETIYISADEDIRQWAKSIAKDEQDIYKICSKIRSAIYAMMSYTSQMGLMRNASDIFSSKNGVCRDYAILFAAACRSLQIPARIACGVIYNNDAFYYHAWVECFTDRWIPFDATQNEDFVDATHIKFTCGNEDAMLKMNRIIGTVKIEIL